MCRGAWQVVLGRVAGHVPHGVRRCGVLQVMYLTMYGFVGLNPDPRAVLISMAAISLLGIISFQTLVMYAYLLPNQDMAILACISHATLTILLAGFVVRLHRMYSFLQWASYLFPARYALQIVLITQWRVSIPSCQSQLSSQNLVCSDPAAADRVVFFYLPSNLFISGAKARSTWVWKASSTSFSLKLVVYAKMDARSTRCNKSC